MCRVINDWVSGKLLELHAVSSLGADEKAWIRLPGLMRNVFSSECIILQSRYQPHWGRAISDLKIPKVTR